MGRANERTLLLAAAFIATAFLAPASASADLPALGVNDTSIRLSSADDQRRTQLATTAKELGSSTGVPTRIWRLVLPWDSIQPTNAADPPNWTHYDKVYAALRAADIAPLWIVMRAPTWARDPLDLCIGLGPVCPPANSKLGQWQNFVYEVVKQYPESAGIEVWNEPNFQKFWETALGPNPVRYGHVLNSAYKGVQQAEAELASSMPPGWEMPVLLGGLANPNPPRGIPRVTWLHQVYNNNAASNSDVISAHAYPAPQDQPPDTAAWTTLPGILSQYASVRDARGDSDKPIWLTETGYHTVGTDGMGPPATPKQQGEWLACAYGLMINSPYNVDAFIIHSLVDTEQVPTNTPTSWGLLRNNLDLKTPAPDGYSTLDTYFSTIPAGVDDCDPPE